MNSLVGWYDDNLKLHSSVALNPQAYNVSKIALFLRPSFVVSLQVESSLSISLRCSVCGISLGNLGYERSFAGLSKI